MKNQIVLDEKHKRVLDFISPKREDKILVIGTGVYPKIEKFLYEKFKCEKITSGDIDKKNIENGKNLFPKLNFIYLDAQKRFELKDNTFDAVVMTEVLEHLKYEKIVLGEIKRVLHKNGRLIISVPKTRWFNLFNPITHIQHFREYNEKSIEKVLKENGFYIQKQLVGGNIYELLNLWIHLLLKYGFRTLKVNPFFEKNIERSWKKNYSGKGTDIILIAKKINN